MHSSRIRTVRNSSRLLGGCLAWGVSARGVCSGGCLVQGGAWSEGVCSGGAWSGGVCSGGGWYPSMHWGRPPVNRMTDRCKNITFATSLWTAITNVEFVYVRLYPTIIYCYFKNDNQTCDFQNGGYCPPTKLREGNVFSRVCLSTRKGVPCDHYPQCIGPHCKPPTAGPGPASRPLTWDLTVQGPPPPTSDI